MKRIFTLLAFASLGCANALNARAQHSEQDSLRMYDLQQIEVTATRASEKTPVAYADISRETIEKNNYGLDVPFMLTTTPR